MSCLPYRLPVCNLDFNIQADDATDMIVVTFDWKGCLYLTRLWLPHPLIFMNLARYCSTIVKNMSNFIHGSTYLREMNAQIKMNLMDDTHVGCVCTLQGNQLPLWLCVKSMGRSFAGQNYSTDLSKRERCGLFCLEAHQINGTIQEVKKCRRVRLTSLCPRRPLFENLDLPSHNYISDTLWIVQKERILEDGHQRERCKM